MSYYRSYFKKNNTILKGLTINTAKNPNTEIFYGSGFSKFIFQIDVEGLINHVNNGNAVINDDTRHRLHIKNTIFGDEDLSGSIRGSGRQRTTSFDLILFRIPEYWDEGVGYDYEQVYDYSEGNLTFDVRPSNWFNRTSISGWTSEGIYQSSPTILTTIHFDNGNEDVDVDITEYINDVINGDITDYGLGLAFDIPYEMVSTDMDQSVSFFTKYTQTFWEPYLETVFDDTIDDHRDVFHIENDRNLYLYVTHLGNAYDLDENPVVDILDYNKLSISGLTNLPTVKVRKGVYKVTFGISGQLCDGKRFFYDKWCNLKIDGYELDCVTQRFIPKPFSQVFDIGQNQTDVTKYSVQIHGVGLNEKIKRGSTRKVSVKFKSIDTPIPQVLDEAYYRIYVKEGKTHVNVFDWTRMDRTNENSFVIDTSYLIPREYYVEIKARVNSMDVIYRDEIKFEIISEKV